VREQVLGEGRRSALVMEDGVTVGLISLSDARRVPRDAWSTTPVRQVMTSRESLHTVAPEAGLVEVLELLGRHRLNQIPVGRDNELTGWLDRDEVLQALRIRLELEGGGP
jgi:CBS domain-containing protein